MNQVQHSSDSRYKITAKPRFDYFKQLICIQLILVKEYQVRVVVKSQKLLITFVGKKGRKIEREKGKNIILPASVANTVPWKLELAKRGST